MNKWTITIGADGLPEPSEVEVKTGDTIYWVSTQDDWVVSFPPKKFLIVNHWPFRGAQTDVLVSQTTGSLEYVAERNLLRKEYHYMTARRGTDGKIGPMGNGARIIVR